MKTITNLLGAALVLLLIPLVLAACGGAVANLLTLAGLDVDHKHWLELGFTIGGIADVACLAAIINDWSNHNG